MLKHLTMAALAAIGTWTTLPSTARAADTDFCLTYANSIVATNYRAQQRQCPQFRGANMDWEAHFNWCGSQPEARVKAADETNMSKLDGCLTSAAPPPPVVVQAPPPPPRIVQAPPPQRAPAPGKSFYAKAEGADEPSLCIDVAGGQYRPGTPIQLWKCHQQGPQRFGLEHGLVFVTAMPNLCVDGADKQPLRLVSCDRVSTKWQYDRRADVIRSSTGLCWDIHSGNVPNNIRMQQKIVAWRCHNGINQQFVLND